PAVGRPGRLGGRRRPGAGPGPAGAERDGRDRDPDHPAASVLPARRLRAVVAEGTSTALVALLARPSGPGQRPAGPDDRAGRGLALVRADGPWARLGGDGGAEHPPRAAPGRPPVELAGAIGRAGGGDAAPGPVRGCAG